MPIIEQAPVNPLSGKDETSCTIESYQQQHLELKIGSHIAVYVEGTLGWPNQEGQVLEAHAIDELESLKGAYIRTSTASMGRNHMRQGTAREKEASVVFLYSTIRRRLDRLNSLSCIQYRCGVRGFAHFDDILQSRLSR
jgi:hypothetical protein